MSIFIAKVLLLIIHFVVRSLQINFMVTCAFLERYRIVIAMFKSNRVLPSNPLELSAERPEREEDNDPKNNPVELSAERLEQGYIETKNDGEQGGRPGPVDVAHDQLQIKTPRSEMIVKCLGRLSVWIVASAFLSYKFDSTWLAVLVFYCGISMELADVGEKLEILNANWKTSLENLFAAAD